MTKLEKEKQLIKNIVTYDLLCLDLTQVKDMLYTLLERVQAEIVVLEDSQFVYENRMFTCVDRTFDNIDQIITEFNRYKKVFIFTLCNVNLPGSKKIFLSYIALNNIVYLLEEDLCGTRRIRLRKPKIHEQ